MITIGVSIDFDTNDPVAAYRELRRALRDSGIDDYETEDTWYHDEEEIDEDEISEVRMTVLKEEGSV